MDPALQDAIIAACTNNTQQNWGKNDYRQCITMGTMYFVKYDAFDRIKPEAATQTYIHSCADSDPAAPRVAKVLFVFDHQLTTYLVMEFIQLVGPADADRKASALEWLLNVTPPPGHVLGPVGGGRIRHDAFKDYLAPVAFEDVAALDRYFARAYKLLSIPGQRCYTPISLSNDRTMFSQSDMHDSNFGVDDAGRTVILDFDTIGLVPETLILSTLKRDVSLREVFPALCATKGLSGEANLKSLAAIRYCLWMASNPKLGLGKDGFPISTG